MVENTCYIHQLGRVIVTSVIVKSSVIKLQLLGTDDSGAGTHREVDDLGRERPLGSTLTRNDLPGGTSRERCSRSQTAPGMFPGIAVTRSR